MTNPLFYLYRRGDGNEGNFCRALLEVDEGEDLGKALKALIVNDFISGHSRRYWIRDNLEIDGEAEHPLAVISEGPRHETACGAAWMTAELEPLDLTDAEHYRHNGMQLWRLRHGYLDKGTLDLLGPLPDVPYISRPVTWVVGYEFRAESGSTGFADWTGARRWLCEQFERVNRNGLWVPLAEPDGAEWRYGSKEEAGFEAYATRKQ